MKQIPPAIQDKHRYLKFRVEGETKKIGEVVDAVWSSALQYMGTSGASDADIWIIGNRFDEEAQEGVIKVKDSREDDLRASLVLNTGFEDGTYLKTVKVSGTLARLD